MANEGAGRRLPHIVIPQSRLSTMKKPPRSFWNAPEFSDDERRTFSERMIDSFETVKAGTAQDEAGLSTMIFKINMREELSYALHKDKVTRLGLVDCTPVSAHLVKRKLC